MQLRNQQASTLTEEQQIIFDMFRQECLQKNNGKYCHHFMSAFEEAQRYLIRKKIIKKEQCEYGS